MLSALVTFIIVLFVSQLVARRFPNNPLWEKVAYLWVIIAALSIFTALGEKDFIEKDLLIEYRGRVVESVRQIAKHQAEAMIVRYRSLIQAGHLIQDEIADYESGIAWFESAARSLSEVRDSRDWVRYLPGGVGMSELKFRSKARVWIDEDRRWLSEQVENIERERAKYHMIEAGFKKSAFYMLFSDALPFLLAISAPLQMSAITAQGMRRFG